ncbi:MAG: hypothetical protein Kow00106_14910 [Anaerolineae bacterium]
MVAIVIFPGHEDTLSSTCEQLEQESGKGKFKWGKAEYRRRNEYLRRVFAQKSFKGGLGYAVFHQTTDYDRATIQAIVKALQDQSAGQPYRAIVYVDGLSRTKEREYMREFRKRGVPVYKVRGIARDENSAPTRLADAIAGFVRDILEGAGDDLQTLFAEAIRAGMLSEISA